MSGDPLATIVGGIFVALFYLGFCVAPILGVRAGVRALVRKLGNEEPSKGFPGWVLLLGSFIAMGAAGTARSRGTGGAVGIVAADFLVLLTIVIAVTLLVRAVVRAVASRGRRQQDPDASPSTAAERELPPDQPS